MFCLFVFHLFFMCTFIWTSGAKVYTWMINISFIIKLRFIVILGSKWTTHFFDKSPPPRSLVNEFVALIIGIYFSPVTVSPHPIRFSISPWMTPYNVPNWLCNYTYSHTMCNFYSRTRISLCYCLISSYFPMNDSPLRTDFFHAERKNSILIGSQLVLFIHSMYDWKEKSCELCVLKIQSWG